MAEGRNDTRTLYEAILDVRYGMRFNELNERLYQRIDKGFGFVGLFGGSVAFAGAISGHPNVAATFAALIAASAVMERLMRPVECALEHAAYRRKFADLDARASEMQVQAVDSELRRLQGEGPPGIGTLAVPAFNANLRSNGREDALIGENAWQRLVAFLA